MDTNYLNKEKPTVQTYTDIIIKMVDEVPNFIQQWQEIDDKYNSFRWQDKLSDRERIQEYKEINKNYKQYITNKRKEILDLIDKPGQLYKELNKWIIIEPQASTRGWERWFIVYVKLYKEWLLVIRKFVKDILDLKKQGGK